MSQTIYLDNAATTPLSEQVLEEMMPYLKDSYGNPSSVYDLGVANKSALLTARKRIAKTLNCANPQNIYFTSGGTESDNWAIIGTAEQCKKERKSYYYFKNRTSCRIKYMCLFGRKRF